VAEAISMNGRVVHLEEGQQRLFTEVGSLRSELAGIGGKIDKIADSLATVAPAAEATADRVRLEIREEQDRKARDRSDLFKNALAGLGGVALIVTAIGGPWVARVGALEQGQSRVYDSMSTLRQDVTRLTVDAERNRDAIAELRRARSGYAGDGQNGSSGRNN